MSELPPIQLPADAAVYVQAQRALRLYQAQLQHVGARVFVCMAHGPLPTFSSERYFTTRAVEQLPEVIEAATAADLATLLPLLLDGNLYEAYRYISDTIWPAQMKKKWQYGWAIAARLARVNDRPYVPVIPPRPQVSRPEKPRAYRCAVPPGLANQEALLSVSAQSHCTLSKPLLRAANLSAGDSVHLVVPARRGESWYLDTRPKPGAGRRLPLSPAARAMFKVPPVPARHFSLPKATHSGDVTRGRQIVASENRQVPLLHFRLGPEHPEHPGYYQLLPVTRGTVNQ